MRPAGALDRFLIHYDAGEYFDAHEALEEIWRRSDDALMQLLHGLIQLAVAMEHWRRGNPRGARVLLDRAWSRLERADGGMLGLDLEPVRRAQPGLRAALVAWEAGGPRPELVAPGVARLADPAGEAGPPR